MNRAVGKKAQSIMDHAANGCSITDQPVYQSLFTLAVNGIDLDAVTEGDWSRTLARLIGDARDVAEGDRLGIHLKIRIVRGFDVLTAVCAAGEDRGVRSINDAKCLRLMLAYCIGLLDDLTPPVHARWRECTKIEIAEIWVEIRDVHGELNEEWK